MFFKDLKKLTLIFKVILVTAELPIIKLIGKLFYLTY